MTNETTMWISGNGVELGLSIPPHGPLLRGQLPDLTLMAMLSGGELLRYTYDVTDPETGQVTSGAARLMIEPLPDPRDAITATEEHPATPDRATVFPSEAELADRIFGPGTAEKLGAPTARVCAFPGKCVASTERCGHPDCTAAPLPPRQEWLERPSGPPARVLVEGPGCTPAEVPNEAGTEE